MSGDTDRLLVCIERLNVTGAVAFVLRSPEVFIKHVKDVENKHTKATGNGNHVDSSS